ncbi:nitrogen fixation protein NifQ [Billgrantia endophytica]|uniref:Nitrogen fixation protein NifQ n=1 Tax=Billgrantia endophytica TaxID=2033802 RepID=A0A2N7TZZ9_9GAMM|nr:nitrogen fixation protein NifQ [Halomonas endophytica]PMR73765.1 nitrogen fixation protein NifQ [Halomonas endophytica]
MSGAQALRLTPDIRHRPEPNHTWLRQIHQAQRDGLGCLPFHLGLDEPAYAALIQTHLPELARQIGTTDKRAQECGELRAELLEMRRDEWWELHDLLLSHRHGNGPDGTWMAGIVAAGCLGGDHLWRDLGLDSRQQLSELLEHNFPRLVELNVQDMRWKKFFYKQLCEREGGYVCRAPSCDICPTYHDCFGEEQ